MNIYIGQPQAAQFWRAVKLRRDNYWSFRVPPVAVAGDTIYFCQRSDVPLARATVERVEGPDEGHADWRVLWKADSFVDMRKPPE